MSLVVCSNKESDATIVGRDQSIFKPYSFRNALSSTMMLPKNCQVALESVKYNLDGTVALSGRSRIMYFYYGEDVSGENDDMDDSTAVPIRIPLVELAKDQVIELTFTELVQKIQDQLNKFVFHPNLRDLVTCSVLRDGTTDELQGIQIDFGQYSATDSVIPTTTKEFGAQKFDDDGENPGWSYENGSFVTNDQSTDDNLPAVALLSDKPISLNEGELIVDFSDANDANVEWRVGLSRYVDRFGGAGSGYWSQDGFFPPYMSDDGSELHDEGPQPGMTESSGLMFADYLVCRVGDTLKVCHTAVNSSYTDVPTWLNVSMGNSAVIDDYNLRTNSANYTKVKFKCRGQQIKIFMLEADDTEHVLYTYSSAYADDEVLKPINQSCWSLYPVLSIDRDDTTNGQKLVVETFMGCENITNHNIDDDNNSWYQACEASTDINIARDLEIRPWNDVQADKQLFNIQAGINGSGAIELLPSIITAPSIIYEPTPDANSMGLLGFAVNRKEGKYLPSPDPANTLRIVSTKLPTLLSTKTMFVRLENFTQECANARMGNRSKIIAHLPRFDGQVETGRIFHQPNERVYLDLNNSEPLRINSFDISFCYTNEQYATNLTGQAVVVLHFKQKGT